MICGFSYPGRGREGGKEGGETLPVYDTRFLELVWPKLAVLERRDRTGVALGGVASLGQPCCSRMSMQPRLPVFLAILWAVWPWLSVALTSIPYCTRTRTNTRTVT